MSGKKKGRANAKKKRDKLKQDNPRGNKRGGRKSIIRGRNNYGDPFATKKLIK